jgi:nucleoside-triphosphatase THEP1
VGKTTVCQAVAELARCRGYRPDGVITPALYACPEPVLSEVEGQSRRHGHGVKVGFEAVDVGSGGRWPLARTDPSIGSGCGPSTGSGRGPSTSSGRSSGHRRELGGPRVGPYSFDPAALARALRVLRRAATLRQAQDAAAGCDLLMVDEIGPLELEQGEGFAPILELLPVEGPTHTLIVVRPALLDQLLLHLRETVRPGSPEPSFATPFKVFSVTEENRNKLPLRIVEELWGDG